MKFINEINLLQIELKLLHKLSGLEQFLNVATSSQTFSFDENSWDGSGACNLAKDRLDLIRVVARVQLDRCVLLFQVVEHLREKIWAVKESFYLPGMK